MTTQNRNEEQISINHLTLDTIEDANYIKDIDFNHVLDLNNGAKWYQQQTPYFRKKYNDFINKNGINNQRNIGSIMSLAKANECRSIDDLISTYQEKMGFDRIQNAIRKMYEIQNDIDLSLATTYLLYFIFYNSSRGLTVERLIKQKMEKQGDIQSVRYSTKNEDDNLAIDLIATRKDGTETAFQVKPISFLTRNYEIIDNVRKNKLSDFDDIQYLFYDYIKGQFGIIQIKTLAEMQQLARPKILIHLS